MRPLLDLEGLKLSFMLIWRLETPMHITGFEFLVDQLWQDLFHDLLIEVQLLSDSYLKRHIICIAIVLKSHKR